MPDGSSIGLFLGDYFAREGKRGGAWMSNFVDQSFLFDTATGGVQRAQPAAIPPPANPPCSVWTRSAPCSTSSATRCTACSPGCTYPRLSGTDVPRDFVEYPSQVNEMWILWPDVLEHYARHVVTGEPLPAAVVQAIRAAEQWGEGFGTTEYLAATAAGPGMAPDPAGRGDHRRRRVRAGGVAGRRHRAPD